MTTDEAKAFYDGNVSALARALGIDQSSIYSWKDEPPLIRQIQLERITGGRLKAAVPWVRKPRARASA